MIAYADTSFLLSLYGQDAHSSTALAEVSQAKPVFMLTPFGETEFTNALQLRLFHKDWTPAEARAVRTEFRDDLRRGIVRSEELPPEVFSLSRTLSRRHTARMGARTLDILHVASALLLHPEIFYSFDDRQRRVAKAEGLKVRP